MIKPNSFLEINTKNLIHNYKALSKISYNSLCAATVKADAYGIGAIKTIEILEKNKCKHFFVATLEEALLIRKKKKKTILYILNGMESNNLLIFKKNDLIPIINSIKELKLLIKNNNYKKPIKYGLHIDTGLNRLGISINELNLFNSTKLKLTILISHLSSGDEIKNNYNIIQNKKFKDSFKNFKNIKYKSISNSMGIILGKNYHHDLVRPGISIYGGHFNTKMKSIIRPVICLKSKVLQIKEINKNEFVGYNQTFKTSKKIKVAIIAIGYADGISRVLSNKGEVYHEGKTYKIIGRVSMDSITIDITKNYQNIKEGVYMELINHEYGIDYHAKKSRTICDEVLTSISKRVKRVYI